MFWPFGKKQTVSTEDGAWWVAKVTQFTQKVAKIRGPMARDLVRSLGASGTLAPDTPHKIELELVVLCLYLAEKDLKRRYVTNMPPTMRSMLLERAAKAMGEGQDELAVDGLRDELATLFGARESIYRNYPKLRAGRKEPETGTLADIFGKMITGTYAQRNAMARVIVTTSAAELVKTMPAFLDEVGFAR